MTSKENHKHKTKLSNWVIWNLSIKKALDEGTIEWAGGSDFVFHAVGAEAAFMLCNDADLHIASTDSSLLLELSKKISLSGIKFTIPASLFEVPANYTRE